MCGMCLLIPMHIGNSRRVGRSFTLFGSKFPFQVHQRKTYLMNTSARGFFFDHCWTVVLDTTGFARSFARSLQRGCGSRSGFHHALPQPFHSHSSGHNFFSSTDKCASPVWKTYLRIHGPENPGNTDLYQGRSGRSAVHIQSTVLRLGWLKRF